MLRFYGRLSLFPFLLFTASLLLVRAQPYDNQAVQRALLPADCSAPCFMGIHPGVTTFDEAVNLLKRNKWVGEINNQIIDYIAGHIRWKWKPEKPDWINSENRGDI